MAIKCLFALGLLALASSAAGQSGDVEQVGRRSEAFFASLAAKDADRASEFFTDDAILQTADRPAVRGRAAVRQFYAKVLGFLASSTGSSESVRVATGGDMAYEVGRTRNEFQGSQGPVAYDGKYLIVWVKDGGAWRIAAYALSSDQRGP